MINLRYTVYGLVMKLPSIGSIRMAQDRILEIMRVEAEQKRRESQQVHSQAHQVHMELLNDFENPDYFLGKKEEFSKIEQLLCKQMDENMEVSQFRISDD